MPDIDIGALLPAARGIELLGALSLFGTLAGAWLVVPPGAANASLRRHLSWLVRASLAVGLAGAPLWLAAQTVAMTDAAGPVQFATNAWSVATRTHFGISLVLRSALLVTATLAAGGLDSRRRLIVAALLAGTALALQSQLGHAAAADDAWFPLAVAVHVMAAGAWLGGLVPLALIVQALPAPVAARALRRFSRLGLASILALIGSAVVQSDRLIGDLGGWFGTPYGRLAFGKIAGLASLLLIAGVNRFILTPRAASHGGRRALLASIILETLIGLVVVSVAVRLATLPPAAHEVAVWPFAERPDLSQIGDPYIARHVWRIALIAGVLALALASLFWRRTRLIGPALAVTLLWLLPSPNLQLLAKPAYPTSFQHSETGYSVASIARGLDLVKRHCTAECFRPKDDPTDLTPYGLWQRPDGDLFWWLTETFDRIGHSPFAYGTIAGLEARQRWQLIDYFRARAAGTAVAEAGAWPFPVLAPDLPVICESRPADLRAQRGRPVHVAFRADGLAGAVTELSPELGYLTLIVSPTAAPAAIRETCRAGSPDAWSAYAIASGLDEQQLDGTDLLIDANGWLRVRRLADGRVAPAGRTAPGLSTWAEASATVARTPFPLTELRSHGH
ncbi:putative copper export protein [Ancylobacter sp. 3268]|uniref:CopD family protein n=1 Tax=Ancylobacter sp. 3268 TaxID=2817752 RepID=UPI00285F4308|nr:CopD family protein [Ancylobacter sp. 3268]MDR6951161.1 putative copper export protein [Ancylobacter sp. 3268]